MNETLRESLLDDIISQVLGSFGLGSQFVSEIIKNPVDEGLKTRKARWYPNATHVLKVLRERGYKLGLISNTHWRFLDNLRIEFNRYF